MFELEISRSISCAHYLRGYRGECCHLHGHNYRVCVVIRAAQLDEIGISADFRKLKAAADELLERYDHRCLNDLPEFAERNPTSENLAKLLSDSHTRTAWMRTLPSFIRSEKAP